MRKMKRVDAQVEIYALVKIPNIDIMFSPFVLLNQLLKAFGREKFPLPLQKTFFHGYKNLTRYLKLIAGNDSIFFFRFSTFSFV
jgi:hypothetical protein